MTSRKASRTNFAPFSKQALELLAAGLPAAALLLAALLPALALLLTRADASEALFNADSLFAPALFRDAVLDGGDLRAWSFPPPGFFAPDLALYFLVEAFGHLLGLGYVFAMYACAMIQFALLHGGLAYLAAGLSDSSGTGAWQGGLSAATGTCLLLVILAATSSAPGFYLPFVLLHHTGALILALWSVGLLLRGRRAALFVCVLLGSFGDVFFLGFFVVPALCLTLVAPNSLRSSLFNLLTLLGAAVIGRFLFAEVRDADLFLLPEVARPLEILSDPPGFPEALDLVWTSVARTPWWVWIPYAGGLLVLLWKSGWSRDRGTRVFALVAIAIALGLGVLGATVQNQPELAGRYMLPALVLPLFFLARFFFDPGRTRSRGRWALAIVFAASVLILQRSSFHPFAWPALDPGRAVADCLRAREPGLGDGLAVYGLAKPVDLGRRSRGNVFRVNQIDDGGRPRYWMNSAAWYGPGPGDRTSAPPRYHFVLTAGTKESDLRERFGAPDRVLGCPGTSVWVYDPPLTAPTANEVRLWRTLIGR